jgi:hypothetical protein
MNLTIGTKIEYTCALGALNAVIEAIRIAPTARKNFNNTFLLLRLPVQKGVINEHTAQIAADDSSLKMFKVKVVD